MQCRIFRRLLGANFLVVFAVLCTGSPAAEPKPGAGARRRQTAHPLFRGSSRRLRVEGRRRGGHVGGARASRQVRLRHQRRHRPLARRRRPTRPAAQGGSRAAAPAAGHHHGSAGHSRRRVAADPRKPPHHHPPDPRVEGRHRDEPPAQRLPPRPPLHRHPRAGLGLHGGGTALLPGRAAAEEQSRVPLLLRLASRSRTRSSPTSWSPSTR